MSYEKHVWETNEIITADKLNHMEEGIAGEVDSSPIVGTGAVGSMVVGSESGGTMIVHQTEAEIDKTFNELYTAFMNGTRVIIIREEADGEGTVTYLEYLIALYNPGDEPYGAYYAYFGYARDGSIYEDSFQAGDPDTPMFWD